VNSIQKSLCLCSIFVPLVGSHISTVAQDKASTTTSVAPLITRDRVQLNLAGAELMISAAKKKAVEKHWKVNISVVDDGGHLLAFARMDGARPASIYTSMTKAVTAATYRQETGPLPANGEPDVLLNISLQNAAQASGGKLTTLKGGEPILIDGQVIGAVGVGGGSGEQDAEVARAAVQALLNTLGVKSD
jgi:glc operon protein GlcG